MQTIFQDLRYAFRQLRKSPGFTAIAVISLALAIGANTTIFSFANQMLYVRLGVPHPEQLRLLTVTGDEHMAVHNFWGNGSTGSNPSYLDSFSYPVYQQLRQQNSVLEPIAAFKDLGSVNVTTSGSPTAAEAEFVSGNLYSQLQVRPELGRPMLPSDDGTPGTGSVALLSDAFWHRTFGGSPGVLGKTVFVNSTPVTIIGVNPPSFTSPGGVASGSPQIFLPLSLVSVLRPGAKTQDPLGPDLWWVQLMARAKPGISNAKAQAALDVALAAAVRSSMTVAKDETLPHIVVNDGSRGDTASMAQLVAPIYLLLGFAGLVLLLACTNIANLMLSRATLREREMSVRMALGAGRLRILCQVLTESVLLSALGGAAGLFLGYLGRNIIPLLVSQAWDGADLIIQFDWRVFAFTSAITLITGVLFGIAPAWRSTRASINTALKEGSRSATRRRKAWSGKAIVGFQVALSTLLVMSAAFFVRTIINLNNVNPGFRTQNLTLFYVNPPATRYPAPQDVALHHRLEDAFAAVPGVQGVTVANVPLVAGSEWDAGFHIEGAKEEPSNRRGDQSHVSDLDFVGPTFFSTMQIPILAGRGFTAQDTETSTPVSVVNQALARKFFPNTNPIGKRFRMQTEGPDAKWIEIVGICADTHYHDMKEDLPPIHFDLYRQRPEIDGLTYIVRSPLTPEALMPSLRNAAKQIDPGLTLSQVRTQQQQIETLMLTEHLFASLTAGFGILALALACVGIYGIMAYTVSQRTNEIGIRLALGAAREHIRAMVLRETAWLAATGVLIGMGITFALIRLIQSMLYGLKPTDPLTLGSGTILLLLVAFIAGWVPAHRASQVNPIDALRNE
jgi:predicted permease